MALLNRDAFKTANVINNSFAKWYLNKQTDARRCKYKLIY